MHINYTFQVKAFYDNTDSFHFDYFADDNFLIRGNRGLEFILYTNGADMSAPYFKTSHLQKMNKYSLIELYDNLELGYHADDMTKKELIGEIMRVSIKEYYTNHVENNDWRNIEYDYISRGYSQGNAVKVVFLDKKDNNEAMQGYIDNVLWDSPISANLHITAKTQDGFEKELDFIQYSECQNDSYEYDSESFYNWIKNHYQKEAWYNDFLAIDKSVFNVEVKY